MKYVMEIETAMKWLERQKDADPIQAMHLRSIRDMAALKRMSSLKQEKNQKLLYLNYNLKKKTKKV